jgi:hypothetical protein
MKKTLFINYIDKKNCIVSLYSFVVIKDLLPTLCLLIPDIVG